MLLGVFVTALYTFRMIFLTFHGEERLDHHAQEHFHDVGWDMKGPLVALAIPSLLVGYLTIEPVLFGGYFGSAIQVLPARTTWSAELGREWHGALRFALRGLAPVPAWLAALGVFTAWLFVLRAPERGDALRERLSGLNRVLVNKYYFDWFNEQRDRADGPRRRQRAVAGRRPAIIDGAMVNGSAATIGWLARRMRLLQNGLLYSYAFWMIIGLAVLLGWLLVRV